MNDSGSCELKPLDAINSSGLLMKLMILGHEPMTLNAMNNSRLCMTSATLSHEFRPLDMKNFGL